MYPQSHCTYSYCPPCCCDNVCMWMSGYKDELGVSMLNGRVCGVVFMYPQSHHTYSYCPPCCCDSACMWMSGYKDALGVLDKCAHVPSITLYLQLLPTLLLRQCLHVDVRVQGSSGCFRPVCTCTLNHTVPTVIAHLVVATVPACGCQGTRMHWVF